MRPAGGGAALGGRCAYHGGEGGFSHLACLDLSPGDEPVSFPRFDHAVHAVGRGEAERVLIPVENSTMGRVEPAASLLEQCGLRIVADVWRPARLSLMGHRTARFDDIEAARGHPIALRQCMQTLARMRIVPVNVLDAAVAARDLARGDDPACALLGPPEAAELHGLRILRQDVQDRADNRTRFVLLAP